MDSIGKMNIGAENINRSISQPMQPSKADKPAAALQVENTLSDKAEISAKSGDIQEVSLNELKLNISADQIQSAGKGTEVKTQGTSFISGNVSGWAGSNHVSMTANQSGDNINVNGWIGSGSVSVHEWKSGNSSTLSGHVNVPFAGYQNVSLSAFGSEGNRSISGWIGKDNVYLNESGFAGGIRHITGRAGKRNVDLRINNRNGMLNIEGYIKDMNSFQTDRIMVSGSQNPPDPPMSYLVFLPGLTVGSQDKGNIAT